MGQARSRGLATAVLAAIGFRLFLVIALFGVNRVLFARRPGTDLHAFAEMARTVTTIETVIRGASTFLIVILFMIWVRSELVHLRLMGIQTKTSPGMAIGGWFIPFANFVLPLLGALEVWRLRRPQASSAIPILWWIAYLATMVTSNVALPFPIAMLTSLAAFGLWFAVVFLVRNAPDRPMTFAPFPQYQQPYAPYPR